jgi:HSP20 family protein
MLTQRTFTMHPFNAARRTFDDLFDTVFDTVVAAAPATPASRVREANQPRAMIVPVNLWEDEGNLFVECELPGFRIEDIELSIMKNVLTLSGRRQFEFPVNANIRLRERLGERFERTIELPAPVEVDRAEAHLQHGVLRVTLPKTQQARVRKIEVRSA